MDTSFTHTLFLYLLLQHLLHVLLIVTFSNCQIFCDLFVLAVIEYFFYVLVQTIYVEILWVIYVFIVEWVYVLISPFSVSYNITYWSATTILSKGNH